MRATPPLYVPEALTCDAVVFLVQAIRGLRKGSAAAATIAAPAPARAIILAPAPASASRMGPAAPALATAFRPTRAALAGGTALQEGKRMGTVSG